MKPSHKVRLPLIPIIGALASLLFASHSSALVISQLYGGGGNIGALLTHDFVEIFNDDVAPASLAGLSIQYASATGAGNLGADSAQLTVLPPVVLAPGQYFLIQESSTSATGSALPTPDLIDPSPILMSATAGKIALVSGITSLNCNGGSTSCDAAALARIIDLVGYGNANFYEGSAPAPTLGNSTAALRLFGGLQDTENNVVDFVTGTPMPRNIASPLNPPVGVVAEPATLVLFGVGLAGIAALRRRRFN